MTQRVDSEPIQSESMQFWSEGSRLAADLYRPAGLHRGESGARRFPAVLLCQGWAGLKSQLRAYALRFAASGFVSLTFDYRGWGESDGKLIPARDTPPLTRTGPQTLAVRVVREIIDPVDQVQDVQAALAYLLSESGVDPHRVGIWGTSYGAGHAVFVAGRDERIRAVVAQVGSYAHPADESYRSRARDKARGILDPPIPQHVDPVPGLRGTPDIAKQYGHSPLEAARAIRVPTLVIDAEWEELVDRRAHGEALHGIVQTSAPSEYHTYPCAHYGIYDECFEPAVQDAIGWFQKHLP